MPWEKKDLEQLVSGEIPWSLAKRIISAEKETGRFERIIEILQEKVSFKERILLPIGEHLYIIEKEDGERVVKCDCGHEFGDYRKNWKLSSHIHVRDSDAELEFLYPGDRKPNKDWCEIREFYCPGCSALLEVEAVPPGYPVVFEFLPDLDAFYEEWLKKPLKKKYEYVDNSFEVTDSFGKKG